MRRFAFFLPFFVMGTFALVGCRSAESYLDKGNAEFAQGKFDEATLNYHKAIQKNATFGQAYYHAGLSELKQQKTVEALQDLQQAVKLMPADSGAKMQLTNLILGAYIGDPRRPQFLYDLLIRYSREWLAAEPNSLPGLRIKGYVDMLEQRPGEAVEVFRQAVAAHPEDEKMTLSLMDALFRNKQPVDAEKAGLAYIARKPQGADVYDALYRLYEVTNRPADAGNILAQKVNGSPNNGEYILQLASFYALVHNQPGMNQAMQRFLANPGHDPKVHLKAGDFYAAVDNWTTALQEYNNGISADPTGKTDYQDRIARVLLLQDKKPEATRLLNEVLSSKPDDEQALALRAGLMLAGSPSSNSHHPVQQLQALVDKNPNDVFLEFALSRAQLETDDLTGARKQLEKILQRNPAFLEAQISLADVAFRQGGFAEAAQHAQAALAMNPENTRAELLAAKSLLRIHRLDQASSMLADLFRQQPNSLDVRLELARLSVKKKQFAQAEAAFNQILAAHPDDVRAIGGLVDIDLAQNRPEKALGRLDQEITRTHGSTQMLYLAAITAVRTGRLNEAASHFQRLVDQSSGSIDAYLNLASVLRLQAKYPAAMQVLQQAAQLQPKDPRPTAMLSDLLELTDRDLDAKVLAKKTLAKEPNDPAAMNNLAFLMAQTGDDLDQAMKLAQSALTAAPNEPNFQDTVAFIYLRKGKSDQAMDIFDRLVRTHPDDPVFNYHLGLAYFEIGERAKAKQLLSRTLDLRPPKDVQARATDLMSRLN